MQFLRRGENPNLLIGIFMLLLLAFLAGPNTLPRIVAEIVPEYVFSGVPCDWLRSSDDRARHQSLLGRRVTNPFELTVDSSAIPLEGSGALTIRITIRNNSLGTVPVVYNPNQIMVGDNGTTGMGIIFSNTNSLNGIFPPRAPDPASFPESDVRLLGPRQSCVVTLSIPAGNVLIDPVLTSGTAEVRAYYRSNARGALTPGAGTAIYPDQGLWQGFVQSAPTIIGRAGAGA
jgi:hypothetical protein